MRAPPRSRALASIGLLLAAPLLVAEDCGPIPPEDVAVFAGHPEVVERLEDRHGAAITLLRDYRDRSDEDTTRFRIREGNVAFDELAALRASLPRLEQVVAVEYSQINSPEDPFCGEGGEVTRFELELITRGLLGKPLPNLAVFELCRVSSDGPDQVWFDAGELELRDPAWAARVLRRAEGEAVRLVNAYEIDRQLERDTLLGELLGCPAGTGFVRDSEAAYCAAGGLKHGPYIKGELGDTLLGPRLVEGWYQSGKMHGMWKQFDADGRLLSTTEWQHGERVGWGGGF